MALQAIKGDITTLETDAIVNAANSSLLGGEGVDGAIHRAAGPELLAACKRLNGCMTGDAKLTQAFELPSKFVIHTVGPIWRGGSQEEPSLLAKCYRRSLNYVIEEQLESIAFPCISTGVYGYPIDAAATIAINTCANYLLEEVYDCEVFFCCFLDSDFEIYRELLASGQSR